MNLRPPEPLANQTSGASRTFVVADDRHVVMGYYALAPGAVAHQAAARPSDDADAESRRCTPLIVDGTGAVAKVFHE